MSGTEAPALQWMPIATAPKEGRVLVFNPYFGVYSSEWTVERECIEGDMRPMSDRPIKWQGYPLGLSEVGFGRWYCVPTFWARLPAPPPRPAGQFPWAGSAP